MGCWRPWSRSAKPLTNLRGFGGLGFEEFVKKVAVVSLGGAPLDCSVLIHGARKKRVFGSLGEPEGRSVGSDESADVMAW